MKKICLLGAFTTFAIMRSFSQGANPNALDVLSWNIEWFGSTSNGPADLNLQEANVKKILRYLNADLMGFCEVVDTMRFRRVVDSLGPNFGFKISDFCSNNTTGTGASWLTGQKLAFIYNKNIFSNLTVRGIMRSSSTAYTNWAAGRFPYLLNANVTINSVTKNMNFFMIHGKSGSTASDYDKRWLGANEFKDTLDAEFSSSMNLIIGDYNDALNQTISTGSGPQTSYQAIVVDSTDADHYKSITLPLAYAGQASMINYPNVIDNHIISNEVEPMFVPGSAWIRTDVTSVVPNYTTNNTSDHWPVFSQYILSGFVAATSNLSATQMGIKVFPNPFVNQVNIQAIKNLTNAELRLSDVSGKQIASCHYSFIAAGTTIKPFMPVLSPGIYIITMETKQGRATEKLLKL